jgi:hypothetical protein
MSFITFREEVIMKEKAGPFLFTTVSFLVLVYFWWILIYSHGVAAHH